jgi:hypothetical protein
LGLVNRKKVVADISAWKSDYAYVEEPYVSPDGEQIASIIKDEEENFTVIVNGTPWEQTYDKVWYLRYSPDNKAVALVSSTAEWSVAVEGVSWENWFEFAWNTRFSPAGGIAIAAQNNRSYFGVTNDVPWPSGFPSMSNLNISDDGKTTVAVVQTMPLKEGDIFEFQKGFFTLAVNGEPWKRTFVNAWESDISPDNRIVAVEVRLSLYDYTIAVNDAVWPRTFAAVWRPRFNPNDHSVTAPVKIPGGWTMAKDGQILWEESMFSYGITSTARMEKTSQRLPLRNSAPGPSPKMTGPGNRPSVIWSSIPFTAPTAGISPVREKTTGNGM